MVGTWGRGKRNDWLGMVGDRKCCKVGRTERDAGADGSVERRTDGTMVGRTWMLATWMVVEEAGMDDE